ncbi:MAG: ABC transporter permease subunit, partial [Anaerolineae bacterium]
MATRNDRARLRWRAFLLDWFIWAYALAGGLYYFREAIEDAGLSAWIYLISVPLGALVAFWLERGGTSIGERVVIEAATESLEERASQKRAAWYQTQVGITGLIVGLLTFVLGWQITEINLYYVFTRADRMQNMTDRLLRPYWPVMGSLVEKMIETIFLALMSTVISVPLAALVSFAAARNIMYRLTARWGRSLGSFVLGAAGALAAWWLVSAVLGGVTSEVLDVELIRGLVSPLLILAGLFVGAVVGSRVARLAEPHPERLTSKGLLALFGLGLGGLGAWLLASLVSMVLFGASWSVFQREYGPWHLVVLGLGALAGACYGVSRPAEEQFSIGKVVYSVVRFILNATRSIEPFVWALIFVTWFRLGPFPGMVALMVHSVAALGKLYSEQIESIDPGPLEAVRASGATELQTVVFAVVPQIIPPFISFTIYRWDINVRMSTIIGLVGGGGIGQMLFQFQNLAQWRQVSVAII